MYILKLSANKSSFKEIHFNRTGLNIVKGKRINTDQKATYNGVGKSLLIRIIDFCLGSNHIKGFEKLKDWEFKLEIEINKTIYSVSRTTKEQDKIRLNDIEYTLTSYREFLMGKIFPMGKNYKELTYRSLISRFIRPSKESYVSYERIFGKASTYSNLINASYLLGLSPEYIENKKQLKTTILDLNKEKRIYENDVRLKKIFSNGGDLKITLVNLKQTIKKLEDKLNTFKVSDEYVEIKKSKEELSRNRNTILNNMFSEKNRKKIIEKSLQLKSDLSSDQIIEFYNKAKVDLGENIKKTLNELSIYHEKLLVTRHERLKKDLIKINEKLSHYEEELKEINQQIDQYGEIFKHTGTFEEYEVLNNNIREKIIEFNNLKKCDELFKGIETEKSSIQLELNKSHILVDSYLDKIKDQIEKIISTFNSFTKEFYIGKESGVSIKNNKGNNQQRFDIDAYIDSDSSDGVNEVKIFCFDLTLLKLSNHNNNFLIHDSRILSNMDSRQQVKLFKIAESYFEDSNKQYIISINDNMVAGMKKEENWKEINHLFMKENKKIIIELTDENEKSKLLGETISFDYEK